MKTTKTTAIGALGLMALAVAFVPAAQAVVIDLDTPGDDDVTTDSGVVWSQTQIQPTGTGYINPFLRVKANSSEGAEITEGYNTSDAQGTDPMDDIGGKWTHDLLLSDLQVVDGNFVFLLDANQIGDSKNGGAQLTLSEFQIFTSATAPGAGFTSQAGLAAAFTSLYNMQDDELGGSDVSGVDLAVQQTHGFPANKGSGSGDLLVYIPTSFFADGSTYLILYTEYGDGNFQNNDGFEEWAALTGTPPKVPDGGTTLALLGVALGGLGIARRATSKA